VGSTSIDMPFAKAMISGPCRFRPAPFVVLSSPTEKEVEMQYLLLIHDDETEWPRLAEHEQSDIIAEYVALTAELRESGAYLGSNRLQPTTTASTVRVRDGDQVVTDGPFAETKEQLGGYYLIEAESLDEALEWAGKIPTARSGSIEVRPVAPVPAEVSAG